MLDSKRQPLIRHSAIARGHSKQSSSINIKVPFSVSEVIDTVTILEIKSERISDEATLKNVATEVEALRSLVSGGGLDSD